MGHGFISEELTVGRLRTSVKFAFCN
jgi:hypothetical protein